MELTKNFNLNEFTFSETAIRLEIDNDIKIYPDKMENIKRLANLMQQIRDYLNTPLIITSGYRSIALNDHLKSKRTSFHILGLACDWKPVNIPLTEAMNQIIKNNLLMSKIDQLILEYPPEGWIHLSINVKNVNPRNQRLIITKNGVKNFV